MVLLIFAEKVKASFGGYFRWCCVNIPLSTIGHEKTQFVWPPSDYPYQQLKQREG